MKKSWLKYTAVTIFLILILGLTCCKSNQQKERSEIPDVYFPSVPEPKDGVVIPLDFDFHAVTTDDKEIMYVMMPYWYWNMIIDYMVRTETAVSALYGEE